MSGSNCCFCLSFFFGVEHLFIHSMEHSKFRSEGILIKELYIFFPHISLCIRKWHCDPFHYNIAKYLQENIYKKITQTWKARWGEINWFFQKPLLQCPQHTIREPKQITKFPLITSFQGIGVGEEIWWKWWYERGWMLLAALLQYQFILHEIPSLLYAVNSEQG